jgi:7-carboxy-7-deazaguanine synthase
MTYTVNEVFWSPQGEGMRAGEMSVFVRFTGCNLRCTMEPGPRSPGGFDCDTEFMSGRKMTAPEVLAAAREACGLGDEYLRSHGAWAVFTGGEPGLQVDRALVDAFHEAGFRCAMETNGSVNVDGLGLDWITVSPKVAEHAVRQTTATEVKYVRGYGQALPKPACTATYQLVSPAFNGLTLDRKALEWCLSLIKEDPSWRLSIQMHKAWNVR